MIAFESFICLLCGGLNALGGYHWLFCRRYILPVVLGITFSIITHTWWVGIMVLPAIGTLCLGYFKGNFWGRGLWLSLQQLIGDSIFGILLALPVFLIK